MNTESYDKDTNFLLVLTREQDPRLKVLKKREMIYRLEADMENLGIPRNHVRETVIAMKCRELLLASAKTGWYHDRIRPFPGRSAVFYI